MLHLLPDYLPLERRKELVNSLTLLQEGKLTEPYNRFYATNLPNDSWLQGDLLRSIRRPVFSLESNRFETFYGYAVIISNSCDISIDNLRKPENSKECLMAPAIPIFQWLIEQGITETKAQNSLLKRLRQQVAITFICHLW